MTATPTTTAAPPAPPRTKFDTVRAAAESTPGEWVRTHTNVTRRQSSAAAYAIRAGIGRWAPAGRWDAEARPRVTPGRWDVWTRSPLPDPDLVEPQL